MKVRGRYERNRNRHGPGCWFSVSEGPVEAVEIILCRTLSCPIVVTGVLMGFLVLVCLGDRGMGARPLSLASGK